jgi:hypothetical protein
MFYFNDEVNLKLSICLTNFKQFFKKTYGEVERILDFGTSWKSVVSYTLRPLYSRGKKAIMFNG